ncbi:hypothetical protein [Kibdelosporangium aridum]|uniref:hypothetical protein n=1 Tax=Kibdelosporangium aridum TaxID=2030 RepID=UPI0035EA2873
MRKFGKFAKLSAVAIGLSAVVVAAPASATTEQSSAAPAYSERCETGWVEVKAGVTNLPVRAWPSNSAPSYRTVKAGDVLPCVDQHYSIGENYSVCGGTNTNGWIIIQRSGQAVGYVLMMCVIDW